MTRVTLQTQVSDLRVQLVQAQAERDQALREVTRLRAILTVLKAALAQSELEDVR
jgi:hypothetical protein